MGGTAELQPYGCQMSLKLLKGQIPTVTAVMGPGTLWGIQTGRPPKSWVSLVGSGLAYLQRATAPLLSP